jgi:hypothetical protein
MTKNYLEASDMIFLWLSGSREQKTSFSRHFYGCKRLGVIDNTRLIRRFRLVPGIVEHIHPLVVDCVLPPVSRDYSADIARRTVAGKVCALHDDIGYVQVRKLCKAASGRFMLIRPPRLLFQQLINEQNKAEKVSSS